MRLDVDVSDLNRLAADFARSGATIHRQLGDALGDTATGIAQSARQNVRVLTGRTRSSISIQRRDLTTVLVGPTVATGRFLEYGTRKMPAYPFMAPALAQHLPGLPDRLAEVAAKNTLRRI